MGSVRGEGGAEETKTQERREPNRREEKIRILFWE